MPSCSQTCRRRPLHPPLPLQSANSPYHFCDRTYSIFPISTILFPDTLFRSSHTSPPLVRSRYTPANERKRFTPSPFSTSKGCVPSTTPSLFRIKTAFPSLLFLIHAASPKRFFSVTHPDCRRTNTIFRILTGGIPNIKTGAAPEGLCRFLFLTLYAPSAVPFSPFCFQKISRRRLAASISAATQTQPKPLIKRQHPYQLPDKPQRQPSEAVNPFLKILIKASEPLFSASPQSSGSVARASPAPPASSSHRSGFPPRSAARPSAWPVLPLHRSK